MSATKWRAPGNEGQTPRKVSDTTGKLPAGGVSLFRPVAAEHLMLAGLSE